MSHSVLLRCRPLVGSALPTLPNSAHHKPLLHPRKLSQATAPKDRQKRGPLAGIRILDLSRVLAGPFCTQILADYGADVIKVEQPRVGDDTRHWKVKGESAKWKTDLPMSLYYCSVNRNKKSLTLDLKQPEARNIIQELVKTSDVFVENFIPGKAEKLGLGYEALSKVNPTIVYASISGYGASGPYEKRAGYDGIAAAEGGLMHITGDPDGGPVRPGLGMVDMATGLYMHGAILAALREREISGNGQKIDASLFETQISLLINVGMNWLNLGVEGQRFGAAHPSIVPYNTFRTKDGWFALGANNERQWKVLCQRLGRQDWVDDDRFATNPNRVENRSAMEEDLVAILKKRTNSEWCDLLENSGLPYGPVNSIEEAFAHPQIHPRAMIQSNQTELLDAGSLNMIGPPVKFSMSKPTIRSIAPSLGQHTLQILRELGYSKGEVQDLRAQNIL